MFAGISVGLIYTNVTRSQEAVAANAQIYRQLDLFGDVLEQVRAQYVEEPDDAKLIESAINGMLSGLDPHSAYLPPKNFDDVRTQTRGGIWRHRHSSDDGKRHRQNHFADAENPSGAGGLVAGRSDYAFGR